MERQLGEKREQLNRLRSQLEAKNSELQTWKDDLAQALHNQRLISQRISVFKKQLEEATNQMARAKTAFESLDVDEDAICALRDEMNRFEREKESVCQRASELRKTKEKLEAEIKKVEDRVLGKAQSQLKKWKSELKAAEDTLCRETLVLKNSAATIQRIETTIRRAKDGIEEAEGDVRRATEQLERQRQDVQTRAEEKVALAEQLEELQAAIVRKTEEIAALVQREEEARRPLQDKEKEVEEASREVEKLLKKVQKVDEDIGKLSVIQVRQDILPFLYDAMAKRGRGAQNEETASNRSPNQREGSANSTPASSQQTQEGEEDAPANEQQAEVERMEVDQPEDGEVGGEADAEEVATAIEPVEIPSTTIITADDGSTHDPAFDTGSLPPYSEEEIVAFNRAQLEAKVERYEAKKRAFRTPMNLQLVDDFGEKMDKQNRVVAQMQQLVDEKNAHRRLFDRLSRMRSDEFMDGFQQIRLATQEIYQMITLGGDASLNAIDSLDPFKEGVAFQVRPPKKTWKQITNLSGGEKTLASLALVFGLHNFRPTPLYVMDEIDAALDFRNVSIIATYLKERTKNAQFIIISLRNNMFEKADRLIGIYKVRDCTHNLTVEYGDSLRADRPQVDESQQVSPPIAHLPSASLLAAAGERPDAVAVAVGQTPPIE
ncbi:SMC-N domain-containing protein [Aphelenchoides fujianensis]|nr:SMC-N domain-containing protein [Aphelenchoides fujianensis]